MPGVTGAMSPVRHRVRLRAVDHEFGAKRRSRPKADIDYALPVSFASLNLRLRFCWSCCYGFGLSSLLVLLRCSTAFVFR
jgi:hypothetical protein